MIYKIRYGILDSNKIANIQGPQWAYLGSKREGYEHALGWSEEKIQIRNILAEEHIKKFDNKYDNFYQKLEESILREGLLNPLLIIAGKSEKAFDDGPRTFDERLPPYMAEDHSKIVACVAGGCSRLYIAQKYNLKVPAIIMDFADKFNDFEQLFTEKDILSKFKYPPERLNINERGIFQRRPNQIHLQK